MNHDQLIDALVWAIGPNRELDVRIAVAIDWKPDDWEEGDHCPRELVEKHGLEWLVRGASGETNSVWSHLLPRFTGSIDAALIIEPQPLGRAEFGGHNGNCWAYVHTLDDKTAEAENCDSVPLALCVALLRIKAARHVEMEAMS